MHKNELLSEIKGTIGWITLNRPKALNALSLNIIREMSHLLHQWEGNPAVKAIVIQGAGDKAFCAGGDVKAVYEAKISGDLQTCDTFFREEYTLNTHIHEYKKPYVALIDGIAMGGGLGISINGSHRIVTEKALLAMPETGIGFFPDVGATTFLIQAPGSIGLYLGLTGYRLSPQDALWAKLATHFMPSAKLQDLKHSIEKGTSLEEALSIYGTQPQEKGFLEHHATQIDDHFHKLSLEEIMESLSQDPSPFAQNTLHTLRSKSPTSVAVVFRQLREVGPPLSFRERMKLEFRLSQHFVQGHDFAEGVRAVLVDKDHLPRWKPATLEEANPQPYFGSLGTHELNL